MASTAAQKQATKRRKVETTPAATGVPIVDLEDDAVLAAQIAEDDAKLDEERAAKRAISGRSRPGSGQRQPSVSPSAPPLPSQKEQTHPKTAATAALNNAASGNNHKQAASINDDTGIQDEDLVLVLYRAHDYDYTDVYVVDGILLRAAERKTLESLTRAGATYYKDSLMRRFRRMQAWWELNYDIMHTTTDSKRKTYKLPKGVTRICFVTESEDADDGSTDDDDDDV